MGIQILALWPDEPISLEAKNSVLFAFVVVVVVVVVVKEANIIWPHHAVGLF